MLVTGCSSGTGAATARRPETLAEPEAKGCRVLELDDVDDASRRAAVDAAVEAEGAVGVPVNIAGYSRSGAVETIPGERVRAQFETNVFAPLALPAGAAGHARAGLGKIANVSSMGGRFTFPGGGVYHASKHALEAPSDALRFEVRGFGIDVIVIEPSLIRTRFSDVIASDLGDFTAVDEP